MAPHGPNPARSHMARERDTSWERDMPWERDMQCLTWNMSLVLVFSCGTQAISWNISIKGPFVTMTGEDTRPITIMFEDREKYEHCPKHNLDQTFPYPGWVTPLLYQSQISLTLVFLLDKIYEVIHPQKYTSSSLTASHPEQSPFP